MDLIFADAETYYDKDYSLRKMTPVEYVLDPRYETIMWAIKRPGQPAFWLDHPDSVKFFAGLDPKNTCVVTHNALFDMCILAWRYNFIPALMSDTLSIARACLGHKLRSVALKSVAMELGLGVKGDYVEKVIGLRAADIKARGMWAGYASYNTNDAELCEGIWNTLVVNGGFPQSELMVIDSVLRMALQPKFVLDLNLLHQHLNNIRQEKALLLSTIVAFDQQFNGTTGTPEEIEKAAKSVLMSNDHFAKMLENLGVEPPRKISTVTGRENWAFSKTDPEFMELESHHDPRVQTLFAARVGHKSTIEESRTERLISIANLEWPGRGRLGLLPVPIKYSGAGQTHRFSGDWKLNLQNLPSRGNNVIRSALTAGDGNVILAIDSAQIEARIVAWICGVQILLERFENKEDVYKHFAASVFSVFYDAVTKPQRFIGKTGILGLGFGVGWVKFQRTVLLDSIKFTGTQIVLSDEEAQRIVTGYRNEYYQVPATWRKLNDIGIPVLAGNGGSFSLGPCQFHGAKILLPNGLYLHYHDLAHHGQDGWKFTHGGKPKRLYGGALLENIVQALARIVITDAMLRIRKRLDAAGIYANLPVHDELVYVMEPKFAGVVSEILLEEFNRRPTWAPDLPLASECSPPSLSYGDAK